MHEQSTFYRSQPLGLLSADAFHLCRRGTRSDPQAHAPERLSARDSDSRHCHAAFGRINLRERVAIQSAYRVRDETFVSASFLRETLNDTNCGRHRSQLAKFEKTSLDTRQILSSQFDALAPDSTNASVIGHQTLTSMTAATGATNQVLHRQVSPAIAPQIGAELIRRLSPVNRVVLSLIPAADDRCVVETSRNTVDSGRSKSSNYPTSSRNHR